MNYIEVAVKFIISFFIGSIIVGVLVILYGPRIAMWIFNRWDKLFDEYEKKKK